MVGTYKAVDSKNIDIPLIAVVGDIGRVKKDAINSCVISGSIAREGLSLRGDKKCKRADCEYDLSHKCDLRFGKYVHYYAAIAVPPKVGMFNAERGSVLPSVRG